MSNQNLRREARVDVRVPVVVYRGKTLVALETSDVSFKGLFVRTMDPPALRSLVRLKVALFDREFVTHAMAVHIVPPSPPAPAGEGHAPGVGLLFWGLSGPDRSAWDDFVGQLVHARRAAARVKALPATAATLPQPLTPSSVRAITPTRSSSK